MKYNDLFLRGGFINLLIKYKVDIRKYRLAQAFILILFMFTGIVLFFGFRTYGMEKKWYLLLTLSNGLIGGWLLKLNLFHHLGENKNLFLREIFPMELTSSAIPTIVSIINRKMIWVYLFWFFSLISAYLSPLMDYPNIYMFILVLVCVCIGWIGSNFFLVLYAYYKKTKFI